MKRPKKKVRPRWVCVLSRSDATKLMDAGGVGIGHRCNSLDHLHVQWAEADRMYSRGDIEWVGHHQKIAQWAESKTWAKTPSGPVTTMQLVSPATVAGRRKRK